MCGNGVMEGNETCDGSMAGRSCLEFGRLNAPDEHPECATDCTANLSQCGGPIVTEDDISDALMALERLPGHNIVGLPEPTYTLTRAIFVAECVLVGCSGEPEGATITSIHPDGTVINALAATDPAFLLASSHIKIVNLTIADAADGIHILAGTGHEIRHVQFINTQVPPDSIVLTQAHGTVIAENHFDNPLTGASNGTAITAYMAGGTLIHMNVIRGYFTTGITTIANGGTADLSHNSIAIFAPELGNTIPTAVYLQDVTVCFNNNATVGFDQGQTGVLLLGNVTQGSPEMCGGQSGVGNVADGQLLQCGSTDGSCALCPVGTPGPFCNLWGGANLDAADVGLCPTPGSNLIDSGVDTGHDMVDGDAARFYGLAPESGAREAGSTRRYGRMNSVCPPL
jgi:hypothetical protein